jgi:type I restriction enzyme M protein
MPRPATLRRRDLQPADNLLALFEDCHNYIYANEGLLKERVFHEVVKLLLLKLADEQGPADRPARFVVTSNDRRAIAGGDGQAFVGRLSKLFAAARRTHPHLLADDTDLALRPATLAWLVERLQGVSLSRTPGDVKGAAFQTFVYRNQRGDRGEFFTPHPIVELAVRMLDPRANERIIDPACGSGGFLIEAIKHIRTASSRRQPFNLFVRRNVRGIEFNPHVARAAAVRLAFEGGTGDEILCRNALAAEEMLDGQFDVLLTNPPFGSRARIEDAAMLRSFDLARRWTTHGDCAWQPTEKFLAGQSPEVLFIERSLALLRPGGRMAIVLPDGLLQNPSCGYLRQWLLERTELMAVVSAPLETFVPYGTGIKTSLVLLRKRPCAEASTCFMARLWRIGYDVKGQAMPRRDTRGVALRDAAGQLVLDSDVPAVVDAWRSFEAGKHWQQSDDRFVVPRRDIDSRIDVEHYLPGDRQLVADLTRAGARPLGDLATILQETDEFRGDGGQDIRYIAISDIHAATGEIVRQQRLKAHEAPSRARYRLRTGDIITAISGASTGTPEQATALVTDEEDGAICSNGLAVLRDVRGVRAEYLLIYLRSEPFLRQVRRLMTGHAIPAITRGDLAGVLVLLPSPAEQTRIARRFARIQALRKQVRDQAETLRDEVAQMVDQPPGGPARTACKQS